VQSGHITPLVDRDGAVRQQPAIVCHDGKPYPALFLSAAMKGTTTPQISLVASEGLFSSQWELTGLPLYKSGIPLDQKGNIRIPWTLRQEAFVALSAQDVLAGRVPQGLLNNAWVLIGSTALGLNDRIATPFSGIEAGMLVHLASPRLAGRKHTLHPQLLGSTPSYPHRISRSAWHNCDENQYLFS
jgi:adenylate cyclase